MSTHFLPYEQLPFTNNFIFCKVLSHNLELTRQLLQLILQIPVREVKLSEAEKAVEPTPASRGVRFDVYAEDAEGSVFDIEMQTTDDPALGKRMRYYQSMIDADRLERNMDYRRLPRSFVIFICLKKPEHFSDNLPIYRFRERCMDAGGLELGDEAEKLIVNAAGSIDAAPQELADFLHYLCDGTVRGALPQAIDADVIRARRSKRWRNEYMTYEMEIHLATLRAEEKGLEKGLKKGFEKGRKEEREEVIEKLMKKLSLPREKVEEMLK